MASKSPQNYQLIDDEPSLKKSLCELKSHEPNALLAVDCEGVDLSRKGELIIVAVATAEKAYIFDILALKRGAFDSGLCEILEDKSREKLMFDCRQDSDSLMHQFRVKLAGVLDVQLLEVMYRREDSASSSGMSSASYKRRSQRVHEVENINGFRRCIELYTKDEEVLKNKESIKKLMQRERSVWRKRPLPEEMLRYCAVDTLELFKLYPKLKGANDEFIPRLRVASERYADMYRCKKERKFDDFETNAFLPLDIIPDKGSLTFPFANTTCTKCKRLFPYEEFSKTQLRNGEQKCRVCKKVKFRADVQANRENNWLREEEREDSYIYDDDSDEANWYGWYDDEEENEPDCYGADYDW